jgi:hypothetical protein
MIIISYVSFYKKLYQSCLRLRIVACKRNLLLVKHFHIKQQFRKKNRLIKKESHYPFCNGNEHNGFTSMRGNETVNLPILVFHTKL